MEIYKYTKDINLRDKGIYMISHKCTDLVYVGSTIQQMGFEGRWRQHLLAIKKGNGNVILHRIYKKYGIEGFEFSILERMNNSTEAEIREREAFYIQKYNSYYNGANRSLSTDCSFRLCKHFPMTNEQRQIYKEACSTKKPMYVYDGKGNIIYTFESSVEADRFFGLKKGTCGDKARYGWSLHNKYWFSREIKKWIPEEIKRERIRTGQIIAAEKRKNNGNYYNRPVRRGFHISEITKIKERLSNQSRIIIDLYTLDGVLVKTFNSLNECDDYLGLTRGSTSKVLKGKAKTLKRKYIPVKHTNTVLTN